MSAVHLAAVHMAVVHMAAVHMAAVHIAAVHMAAVHMSSLGFRGFRVAILNRVHWWPFRIFCGSPGHGASGGASAGSGAAGAATGTSGRQGEMGIRNLGTTGAIRRSTSSCGGLVSCQGHEHQVASCRCRSFGGLGE